ncbi:replication initiation factor domain-containing protein [Pseudoxanthomonas sp.]|uniref:replication initiation factor domain-containing protein n=1 Tax=Pseudoxanthomonas sp. TaxID=1871049 RepID=UPI0026305765|nr:replication initiation factor domain-containing protein [Pseudoxanthomonas sp.]WDS36973.1 MAG: replication initiation factor domain-containing protein [Pseudoxanthomonas sp.]
MSDLSSHDRASLAPRAVRGCAGEVVRTFSRANAGKADGQGGAVGPSSNTGQKGQSGDNCLIDFLTLTVPYETLEERRLTNLDNLLGTLFGFSGEVNALAIRDKRWQHYAKSSILVDRDGEVVGRIGLGGNRDSVCVSLSGAGCKWVKNWHTCRMHLQDMKARISRVDVAHDDYEGERLDVHALRAAAQRGEFAEGGCPPRHRFLSDEGYNTGNTLYVGAKGHKELCVYEKGKQLGDKFSRWVRAEVRLYGKHMSIPFDVLTSPGDYLRGSYGVLRDLITGLCSRLATTRKTVEASGLAMVRWAKRQIGPTLNVLRGAFHDSWGEFLETHVVREGHPGRFRGIPKGEPLERMLREELSCLSAA